MTALDMKDDRLRRTLERHEALRRQLEPFSVRIQALQPALRIRDLIADADRTRHLMHAALGVLAADSLR